MSLLGRPSAVPLWRDEFPVDAAQERYVSRRQFAKFLVLTSAGMLAGNAWILLRARLHRAEAFPMRVVAHVGDIPVGTSKVFLYPGPHDACLLIRTADDEYVAFSQKCTHLSCAVFYAPDTRRLECPCHNGAFSARDGAVLQGPPPRPLPRVELLRRGTELVAVGVTTMDKS
jgi:Rieske Fe-S protein